MNRKRALFSRVRDPDDFTSFGGGSIGAYRLGHGWTGRKVEVANPIKCFGMASAGGEIPQSAFDRMPPRKTEYRREDDTLSYEDPYYDREVRQFALETVRPEDRVDHYYLYLYMTKPSRTIDLKTLSEMVFEEEEITQQAAQPIIPPVVQVEPQKKKPKFFQQLMERYAERDRIEREKSPNKIILQ